MPAAPATEAPPSSVVIKESAPPPPPPAPTKELHVGPGGIIDKGPAPAPVKKGSAMDEMRQSLRKKAGMEPEPKPAATAKESPPSGESATPPAAETDTTPGEAPPAPEKKGKVSPWKLVDEYKGRAAALEKELAEAKKAVVDPKEKEELTSKLTAAEKRRQELEEEIKYVNYSKSQEFKDKYQKPYEDAWSKAMADLGELTVADETGTERPIAPQDMLALVNMTLKEAKAKAMEMFGDFADDVMAHRKEIRNLFDAQNKALEEARKSAGTRDEQRQRELAEFRQQTRKQIQEVWAEANKQALADEKYSQYFKPIEGDEEGNNRLKRGYELADKAFSAPNLEDPRLKPEQRAEIIKLHAAIRNRSAAFGRTLYQLEKSQAEIAALKAEIAKYKKAEPGQGEGSRETAPAHSASARDSIMAGLRKYAH